MLASIDEFRDYVRTVSIIDALRTRRSGVDACYALVKTYEMDPNCLWLRSHYDLWSMAGELILWAVERGAEKPMAPKWWREKIK